MNEQPWSNRNDLLNSFQKKIERQTHGRLSQLDLEFHENTVAVFAHSDCYYDMQLALLAIQKFSNEHPQVAPTHLEFNVNGHAISLGNQNRGDGKQVVRARTLERGITPSNINVPTTGYKNQPPRLITHSAALS